MTFAAFEKTEMARRARARTTRPQRDTAVAMGKKGNLGDLAPNPDVKNPADSGCTGERASATPRRK